MAFPRHRLRRLRSSEALRALTRETHLTPGALIYPIFVRSGLDAPQEIASMPGQYQLPVESAVEVARRAARLGVGGLILFGIPDAKDPVGSGAYAEDALHVYYSDATNLHVVPDNLRATGV